MVALFLLVVGCASSPLPPEDRDSAAQPPAANPAPPPPALANDCSEALSLSCKSDYEHCLAKDPNGCANLNMCFQRCSDAACADECGQFWAISFEARDYYACLADGFEACFTEG